MVYSDTSKKNYPAILAAIEKELADRGITWPA